MLKIRGAAASFQKKAAEMRVGTEKASLRARSTDCMGGEMVVLSFRDSSPRKSAWILMAACTFVHIILSLRR